MPSLREQIGKQKDFDLPEEEAYLNIIRTAALLASEFNRVFKQHGIGESGYNVLRILRAAGNEGRTWTEIHGDLVVPAPDVTRLVARLERSGLVCRERSKDDRRVIRVSLTAEGRELVDQLDAPLQDLHRRTLGHLSKPELDALNEALVQARAPLESPRPD